VTPHCVNFPWKSIIHEGLRFYYTDKQQCHANQLVLPEQLQFCNLWKERVKSNSFYADASGRCEWHPTGISAQDLMINDYE
jgi:hypothetical protein